MFARTLRTTTFFLLIALIAALIAAPGAGAAGRYVVVLRDGANPNEAARRHGAAPTHTWRHALRGYSATLSDAALARAQRDPAVLLVSPDRVISLGKPGGSGGGTGSTAQVIPTGIERIGAAQVRTNGRSDDDGISSTVDVAVVDTGIDVSHPDLYVEGGANCSSGASYSDGNGHGSHVAGTIGAKDNGIGVVGVAPGVSLWAYRVLNNAGSGTTSSVICGLEAAAANEQIDVVNLSLGGSGTASGSCGAPGDAMYVAICGLHSSGRTVVVAAGNNAAHVSTFTPAAYDEPITVSAWSDFNGEDGAAGYDGKKCRDDVDETFANFSNWGLTVDIAAPGVCIRSTWKGGGYSTISGTSMAAPHVAGAAALWRSLHLGASDADTRMQLEATKTMTGAAIADDPDGVFEGLLSVAGWS